MNDQPPPLPPPTRAGRRCLWAGSAGCVTLAVLLALLIGILVLLVKFIWGLHVEQWL